METYVLFTLLESGLHVMSKNKKKDLQGKEGSFLNKHPIVSMLISCVITLIVTNGFGVLNNVFTMGQRFDDIDTQLNDIELLIEKETQSRETADKEIRNQIFDLLLADKVKPTELFEEVISREYNGKDSPSGKNTNLVATSVVAYNKDTGEEYTVEELSNLRLLLPYVSDSQEIVFYGTFNESGQWDGKCTLNVYENDELMLITDAEYKAGVLLSSKQVFSYELQSGERVWALSDRIFEDGVGSGNTYLYEWKCGYIKDFVLDNVTVDDVLHAEEFITSLESRLEGYYSGDTSDGYFNDDSGDAYMAYFFEDGTVRLLYSGKFKNGTFNDDTGKAWYIVKEEDTAYMYYKGNFKDGEEDHSGVTELGKPPLTLEQIQAYLGDRQYEVELRWSGFDTPPSQDSMI